MEKGDVLFINARACMSYTAILYVSINGGQPIPETFVRLPLQGPRAMPQTPPRH